MGTVTTFDHTADVGLRVEAETLDDLFATAAEGVVDYIVVDRLAIVPERRETIVLAGDDLADLLLRWLNELIYRFETRHILFHRFLVRVAEDGRSLHADIEIAALDRDRHELDHEVKAVTRHGMLVESRAGGSGWTAEFILDI